MARRRFAGARTPAFRTLQKEHAMMHIPNSIRSIVLASAVALAAGCEIQSDPSSRSTSDRYAFRSEDQSRSGSGNRYDARYGLHESDGAAVAAAVEPRA